MFACKVCQSKLLNIQCSVRFNELYGKNEELGIPNDGPDVYYIRCYECGFTFTNHMDNYSKEDFLSIIYNGTYDLIDPEYISARPKYNATRFIKNFNLNTGQSVLDYGGGNGCFAQDLRNCGLSTAHTIDPFYFSDEVFIDKYDFVTSFEVMEHCTNPIYAFDEVFGRLKANGVAVISTLCPFDAPCDDFERLKKCFSYLQPRSGHISIFSLNSLKKIASIFNLEHLALDIGYHIFYDPKFQNPKDFLKEGAR